jgi:hypothetical protein
VTRISESRESRPEPARGRARLVDVFIVIKAHLSLSEEQHNPIVGAPLLQSPDHEQRVRKRSVLGC